MKKVIVLASSGIDSSVLIHEMARNGYFIYPVYVRTGLIWENAEIFWLKKFLKAYHSRFRKSRVRPLEILDSPAKALYGRHWSLTGKRIPGYHSRDEAVYLPGRNLILLTQAAVYGSLPGVREIAIGTLRGNPFPDGTRAFFSAMEKALGAAFGLRFRIHAPFLKLKKREVLRLAKNLPLEFTFSCLKPGRNYKSCGNCNKCREKQDLGSRN